MAYVDGDYLPGPPTSIGATGMGMGAQQEQLEEAWGAAMNGGSDSGGGGGGGGKSVSLQQLASMEESRRQQQQHDDEWAHVARGGADYVAQRVHKHPSGPQMAARVEPAPKPKPKPKLPPGHRDKTVDPEKWVVIDGANVAMKAGVTHNSTRGLANCLQYWESLGYKNIVAFVPQYLMDERRATRTGRVFDDIPLCKQLEAACAQGKPGISSVPSYVSRQHYLMATSLPPQLPPPPPPL